MPGVETEPSVGSSGEEMKADARSIDPATEPSLAEEKLQVYFPNKQSTLSLFFSMKEAPQRLVLVGSCIPHAWKEVLAGFYVQQNAGSTLSHFCIRNSHFFAGAALSLLSGRAAATSAHFGSHLRYF